MQETNPDFACITETWLHCQICDDVVKICGYHRASGAKRRSGRKPGESVTNSEMQKSSAIMCRFGLNVRPFS